MKLNIKSASMIALATAFVCSAGLAVQGVGGNNASGVRKSPTQAIVPPGKTTTGTSAILAGISGSSQLVHALSTSSGPIVSGNMGINGSGLSRQPGTRNWFSSGGMTDGGNVYLLTKAGAVLVGGGELGAVSGNCFDPADGMMYGTYTASALADGLCHVDPLTGTATSIGAMGATSGVDALGIDPTTGTMYGSTGFFYDGNPGDVFTIDKATGAGTDTGADMTPTASCTVAGMAFGPDGTGYVSIGCGVGDIYEWDLSTHTITPVLTGVGGASISGLGFMR